MRMLPASIVSDSYHRNFAQPVQDVFYHVQSGRWRWRWRPPWVPPPSLVGGPTRLDVPPLNRTTTVNDTSTSSLACKTTFTGVDSFLRGPTNTIQLVGAGLAPVLNGMVCQVARTFTAYRILVHPCPSLQGFVSPSQRFPIGAALS